MVGSWCPPISEVHGLASHGLAVRSLFLFSKSFQNCFYGDRSDSSGIKSTNKGGTLAPEELVFRRD